MKKVWIPILVVLILALAVFLAVRSGVFRSTGEGRPSDSDGFVAEETAKPADSLPAAASEPDDALATEDPAEPLEDNGAPETEAEGAEAYDSESFPELTIGEEYVIVIDENQAIAGF